MGIVKQHLIQLSSECNDLLSDKVEYAITAYISFIGIARTEGSPHSYFAALLDGDAISNSIDPNKKKQM